MRCAGGLSGNTVHSLSISTETILSLTILLSSLTFTRCQMKKGCNLLQKPPLQSTLCQCLLTLRKMRHPERRPHLPQCLLTLRKMRHQERQPHLLQFQFSFPFHLPVGDNIKNNVRISSLIIQAIKLFIFNCGFQCMLLVPEVTMIPQRSLALAVSSQPS